MPFSHSFSAIWLRWIRKWESSGKTAHCRAQYSPHHIRATFFFLLFVFIQLLFNCLASALTLSCDKSSLTNFQGLRTIYLQRRKKKKKTPKHHHHNTCIVRSPFFASSDPPARSLISPLHCIALHASGTLNSPSLGGGAEAESGAWSCIK
jgi:hypothetical protein